LPVLSYSYSSGHGDLILKYRWTGVEEGFVMPFGIMTNSKESFRLLADTGWQETRIPDSAWFSFYNPWNGYAGSKENSFTYFHTHCENTE
jgi:hypothetical protein